VHYSPRDAHRIADKLNTRVMIICLQFCGTIMHKRMQLMLIFTFFNLLKPISILNIVFFIEISFCKLIQ